MIQGLDGKTRPTPPTGWVYFKWSWACPYCDGVGRSGRGLSDYSLPSASFPPGTHFDPDAEPPILNGWEDEESVQECLDNLRPIVAGCYSRESDLFGRPTRWAVIKCWDCGGIVWHDFVAPHHYFRRPKGRRPADALPTEPVEFGEQVRLF